MSENAEISMELMDPDMFDAKKMQEMMVLRVNSVFGVLVGEYMVLKMLLLHVRCLMATTAEKREKGV